TGKLNGALWKVGKEQFVDAPFVERAKERVNEFARQGKTVVFVQRERELVGLISLEDVMRPAAKQVIEELKRQGIYTVMLTGDSEETGRSLAAQAGVDAYYANCLPDEKVKRIQKLQERYGKVVMVGDGVNDAPALATASVGVGMGEGTDVALETADVVLVKNELKRIPYTVRLAKRVDRVTKQNIAFSTAVIIALITANFFQSITLPLGVIGHEGSTILVILNGLRLLAAK
ncbi:MAG: HAD-IC family P-type ATPase, partial [Novibacillus thermophilus]